PRMTRDFLIEFETSSDSAHAVEILRAIQVSPDGLPLFGEIDNRGTSAFVTMTYPKEVLKQTFASLPSGQVPLRDLVAFVAIKNGMHDSRGYAFFRGEVARHAPADGSHVASLFDTVTQYFGLGAKSERGAVPMRHDEVQAALASNQA